MRHRRRTFIPIFYRGEQIGHLQWRDGEMQIWTAEGDFIGSCFTRHEAASVLWAATVSKRKEIRDRKEWR